MDYVLMYEKLVNECEKLSSTKGIPQNLKQPIMVDIKDRTTYADLRMTMKLSQYGRSNQTWSAENILGSLSVQSPNTHTSNKEYQGPIPMEIDRVQTKGKDKGKDGKGNGRGKGKGGRGPKRSGRGKGVRQVGGKGYGNGISSGTSGQGVVCYNCGKTGHIASECWSKPSGSGDKVKGKGKRRRRGRRMVPRDKLNAQSSQGANQGQAQVRYAASTKGNEQVRRLETSRVPIIEEVEDDEEYVDVIGMFEESARNSSLRMVRPEEEFFDVTPTCD